MNFQGVMTDEPSVKTLALSGFLFESWAAAITAGTTRTQAGATLLSKEVNRIDTSTAPSAGSILGDGVALPPTSTAPANGGPGGLSIMIWNNTANPVQVYGNGSDTVNGVAGATGIPMPPNSVYLLICAAQGSWVVDSTAMGNSGGLNTELTAGSISAAGSTQATATQLAAMINDVTTVGAGAGVALPASAVGLSIQVQNNGANPLAVYPINGGSDAINGQAANTALVILPGTIATFNCTAANKWTCQPATTSNTAYNAASSAVSFTATAANITGGAAFVELDLTGNPAGSANATLPTVAAMVAALHSPTVGTSFTLRVKNSANSGTWTVVTNTGWTLAGTMTVATGTWRDFQVKLTSLSAATLQNLGGGATL